jgi:hypothetical protein
MRLSLAARSTRSSACSSSSAGDVFEEPAGGGVGVAEPADDLLVGGDDDALGGQVVAQHPRPCSIFCRARFRIAVMSALKLPAGVTDPPGRISGWSPPATRGRAAHTPAAGKLGAAGIPRRRRGSRAALWTSRGQTRASVIGRNA